MKLGEQNIHECTIVQFCTIQLVAVLSLLFGRYKPHKIKIKSWFVQPDNRIYFYREIINIISSIYLP